MFKSRDNNPVSGRQSGLIGQDLKISGMIDSASDIILCGQIEGNVTCAALEIGETGCITGNIAAQRVTINGKVTGDIDTSHLKLMAGAQVNGEMHYEVIEVDAGARVEGNFRPKAKKQTAKSQPADKAVQPADSAEK